VPPPRSPKRNGAVERCNGAGRYEVCPTVELPARLDKIAGRVDAFQPRCDGRRPHGALDGLTPLRVSPNRPRTDSQPVSDVLIPDRLSLAADADASLAVAAAIAPPERNCPPMGPLAHARVLELGSTVAGPFCGRLLADFGADVVKVEPPTGDPVRSMGAHLAGPDGEDVSLYAASILRNKRLVAVDMRQAEGQQVIRDLVRSADVVIENFRPGGLENWGLGYADLKAVKPDLVMARISGFGQSGPYSPRPGFGIIGEAVSGLRHITGDPDRPPARVAMPLTDYITGLYTAFGIALALIHRDRTGEGQVIDSNLMESAFSFMESHVPAYAALGLVPNRAGSSLPGVAPNSMFQTRDGRHILIAAAANPVFARLCGAMGREEWLADPRFAAARARGQNRELLEGLVQQWVGGQDLAPLEAALIAADVPATRIFTMADAFADPHYAARGAIARVPHPLLGEVALAAPAPRLSASPGEIRWPGRAVGADTRAVLAEQPGYDTARIDRLVAKGIVAEAEETHASR
jgi:crotonobetainyl-CoA:carnitine CoA-transferase CaiB-like acyl-CoA transferase